MNTWNNVLNEWSNGNYPQIPNHINKPFIWRTSVINKYTDFPYKEEFIMDKRLSGRQEDYSLFTSPPASLLSKKHKNKYGISSKNLNGDTILVIPKPKKTKEFTDLYYFMKTASEKHKQELWKLVVKQIRKMLKIYDNIWVSSPGLAISYLHIRICSYPKYYENSKLKLIPKGIKLRSPKIKHIGGNRHNSNKTKVGNRKVSIPKTKKKVDLWCRKQSRSVHKPCYIGTPSGSIKPGTVNCVCNYDGGSADPINTKFIKQFGNKSMNPERTKILYKNIN